MADSENRLKPNTFQTPNLLVDKLMPLLEDRELRVLIFATRHIYGWPETNAAGRGRLSVSAFEKGHRGSGGCGLARPAIVAALASLAGFGIMKKDGKPTQKGQLWGMAEHQDEIDWEGLAQRAQARKAKARRQTANGTHAAQRSRAARQVRSVSENDRAGTPAVRSTNHPGGTSNEPRGGTSNEPASGTFNVPDAGSSNELIETQLETHSSKPILETHESTTTGSADLAREAPADTEDVVVDVETSDWILPEIRKLHLTPDAQQELLGHGAEYALAVAWAAQGPGARSPGGLAVTMMRGDGPPDDMLEQAKIAVEIGSTDRTEVDRVRSHRQLDAFKEQARDLVATRELDELPPGPPVTPAEPVTDSVAAASDGLNEKPPGGRWTWREIWVAVLGSLRIQLNGSTYRNWIDGAKAVSCADGVLTVQVRHAMAKEMIEERYRFAIEENVRQLAPVEVRIEFVVAPDLVVSYAGV